MRIARCVVNDQPTYGVVTERDGVDVIELVAGDPLYTEVKPTGQAVALADVRLVAPVIPRSKVVGVGRNFAAHAAEMGHVVPEQPVLFSKPNTSVVGPGEPVVLPAYSENVQCEGELAVVIGRVCKDVPAEKAADVIVGYTCANDVTARDAQRSEPGWLRGKGFDTSCPLGPWLETELDVAAATLTTTVNGDVVQSVSLTDMVVPVPELVAQVSQVVTLLPGDVILTGTPSGATTLASGDEVSVAISGLGTLTSPCVRR